MYQNHLKEASFEASFKMSLLLEILDDLIMVDWGAILHATISLPVKPFGYSPISLEVTMPKGRHCTL